MSHPPPHSLALRVLIGSGYALTSGRSLRSLPGVTAEGKPPGLMGDPWGVEKGFAFFS